MRMVVSRVITKLSKSAHEDRRLNGSDPVSKTNVFRFQKSTSGSNKPERWALFGLAFIIVFLYLRFPLETKCMRKLFRISYLEHKTNY